MVVPAGAVQSLDVPGGVPRSLLKEAWEDLLRHPTDELPVDDSFGDDGAAARKFYMDLIATTSRTMHTTPLQATSRWFHTARRAVVDMDTFESRLRSYIFNSTTSADGARAERSGVSSSSSTSLFTTIDGVD